MASVILTVRVKQSKQRTPSEEVQPENNPGDEEIFTLKNLLNAGKLLTGIASLKGISTAINVVNDQAEYYLSTTGDSYQQELYNTVKIENISKRLNLYERYIWSRQTNYNLMWENRNAEQAARRSGNYLTGNSR